MNSRNQLSTESISKIILPALFAVLLFVVAIFGIALPTLSNNLIDQKKKQITVLTQTVWNVLANYDNEVKSGNIPLEMAQTLVKREIRGLRYGPDGKDYFWINDLRPFMLMHPYFPELEGMDVSNYTDQTGKFIFKEVVNQVQNKEAGFVPYWWQWKDNPKRISPKLSYIKLFKPWGWIIGTGVYLDDVQSESAKVSRNLVISSIVIMLLVIFLLAQIVYKSTKEIRERKIAEDKVYQYQNNLEQLVRERTTELENALVEVKALSGMLPICASCKKIRDDQGYWNEIADYISEHSEAEFTHGICPNCAKKLYPNI